MRVARLRAATAQRGTELDETEVAREADLRAAQTLEADDADRPRAQPALACQPVGDRVGRKCAQTLEIERSAEADERRRPARVEAELAQLGGREASERGGRGRLVEVVGDGHRRANDAPLECPGTSRVDQLPAERAQERLRDRRDAQRPKPAKVAGRSTDERVAGEALEEGRVVVVEREHEAKSFQRRLAGRAHEHAAVGVLPSRRALDAVGARQRHRQHAVAEHAGGVAREPRGEP